MLIRLINDAEVAGRGLCMAGEDGFEIEVSPAEADRLVNTERAAVYVDPDEQTKGAKFPRRNMMLKQAHAR